MLNSLSNLILGWANSILQQVLTWDWRLVAAYSAISATFLLIGGRLARFAKPDAPFLSPVIQYLGSVVRLFGSFMAYAIILVLVAVTTLVAAGYAFSSATDGMGIVGSAIYGLHRLWEVLADQCEALAAGLAIGLALSLTFTIRLIPQWERGKGLPDVEELVKKFKKLNVYDPMPCFNPTKGCFIGKTDRGSSIYVPWNKLRETHVQVMGTTGSGKGVLLSAIAYQCILAGEMLIWLDPKSDRYSPRLMQAAAKEAGRPFVILNLNSDQPAQMNLLAGAKQHEIADLFVAGFDLRGKGTDGDFHRGRDEDAAYEAAEIACGQDTPSIPALLRACINVDSITGQENFWRCLRKLARLPVFNTDAGIDLAAAINQGAVIYVIGSTDSESVKMAQKMLLVRVMQIIKQRDRTQSNPPIAVILDEFKHILSPTALTGLGAVRDFNSHFLISHQSLGDLDSCPGISHAEAYGAVIDNTAIKIIYKIGDGDYAEKLAKMGGKRRTYTDSSAKTTDDEVAAVGSWREAQIYHINPDLITHLPMPSDRPGQASVGVIFGVGNAKLFHTGPIIIEGGFPAPEAASQYAEDMEGGLAKELI